MDTPGVGKTPHTGPLWWGSKGHIAFTIVVFVILASLDNAAMGVLPPLFAVIAPELSVSEALLGLVMALTIVTAAVSAVVWGYWGDRGRRKRLLLYGTLIWGAAMLLCGASGSFGQFLLFQVVTAIGVGCIASVGFSVLNDFVPPRRRGLLMSLWGLSQGIGVGGGLLVGGLLGADNWRLPFFVIAGAGLGFAGLYLFAYEPERGRSEPELSDRIAPGRGYDEKIEPGDLPRLATKRSNVWLFAQGLTAQFAYGSLIWLPRLFAAKAEAAGCSLETATAVGSLFAILFQIGGLFSVLGGHIGDLWQRRDPRGRAMLSAIGILGAIPLFLGVFLLPLHGLEIPDPAGNVAVVRAVLSSVFTNGWVAATFLLALGALALTSVDSPNWFALLSDVNLPEHRGTAFGMASLANGVGRALGNGLAGMTFAYFSGRFASPMNYVLGLALFQLFFVPTGYCYYRATKTTPKDIADVRKTLVERAEAAS